MIALGIFLINKVGKVCDINKVGKVVLETVQVTVISVNGQLHVLLYY